MCCVSRVLCPELTTPSPSPPPLPLLFPPFLHSRGLHRPFFLSLSPSFFVSHSFQWSLFLFPAPSVCLSRPPSLLCACSPLLCLCFPLSVCLSPNLSLTLALAISLCPRVCLSVSHFFLSVSLSLCFYLSPCPLLSISLGLCFAPSSANCPSVSQEAFSSF